MKFLGSIIFLTICTLANAAEKRCAPNLPKDICELEQTIFLKTDFQKTNEVEKDMLELKQLSMKYDSGPKVFLDHILGLADYVSSEAHRIRSPKHLFSAIDGKPNMMWMMPKFREFQRKNGAVLPVGWELPDEIDTIVFTVDRKQRPANQTQFVFGSWIALEKPISIDQMQVIKYPNEVILDKVKKIGNWDGGNGPGDTSHFSFFTQGQDSPMREGLYLLKLKLTGQPEVNGWFFINHADASASPVIQKPSINETFATANPTLQWLEYRSPKYSNFEQRKRTFHISSETDSKFDESFAVINPSDSSKLVLGKDSRWPEVKGLNPGDYYFTVRYEERSFFGDLLVGRSSTNGVPFRVKK